MSKQASKFNVISGKVFCLCFLFALFFANFVLPPKPQKIVSSVYCLLQKTWVKANIESKQTKFETASDNFQRDSIDSELVKINLPQQNKQNQCNLSKPNLL
jgi:hypothetical protein